MSSDDLLNEGAIKQTQLDWIHLRQELDSEYEKENLNVRQFKDNIWVKIGGAATGIAFLYEAANINNTNKMIVGASWRIGLQFCTIMLIAAGYYKYTKTSEYKSIKTSLENKIL